MAKKEQIEMLKSSVENWNSWRRNNLLEEIDLTFADLRFANLAGANLSNADIDKAVLIRADLREANLHNAYGWNVDFSSANLNKAILNNATLNESNFHLADLSEACLDNSELQGSNFIKANLMDASFFKADLSSADLSGAFVSGSDLSFSELIDANLSNAKFNNTDLEQANLNGAKLINVDFGYANLKGANLTNAELSGANLVGADISCTCLNEKKRSVSTDNEKELQESQKSKIHNPFDSNNFYSIHFDIICSNCGKQEGIRTVIPWYNTYENNLFGENGYYINKIELNKKIGDIYKKNVRECYFCGSSVNWEFSDIAINEEKYEDSVKKFIDDDVFIGYSSRQNYKAEFDNIENEPYSKLKNVSKRKVLILIAIKKDILAVINIENTNNTSFEFKGQIENIEYSPMGIIKKLEGVTNPLFNYAGDKFNLMFECSSRI